GTTRMRVQMQWNAYFGSSCGNFTYGEVEDYSLNITSGAKRFDDELTASIAELPQADWFLFPNPANEIITLKASNKVNVAAGTTISIADASGRVIRNFRNDAELAQYSVDISWLRPGSYFLLVRNAEEVRSLKFVRKP
ncbi:MAG: T9SS type A sorting domain-containing protein, partial [Bacteroidota bacterium]